MPYNVKVICAARFRRWGPTTVGGAFTESDFVKNENAPQLRFSMWELLVCVTVACVTFGVLKWLGFETTWQLVVAALTIGAAVEPAWRIYRWWREA